LQLGIAMIKINRWFKTVLQGGIAPISRARLLLFGGS
jgi:hypothetical protein